MIELTYIVKAKNGLHARPAGKLSTLAKTFKSEIKIKSKDKEADAKRLLSVMSLGATCGSELTFIISGEDEKQAVKEISSIFTRLDNE